MNFTQTISDLTVSRKPNHDAARADSRGIQVMATQPFQLSQLVEFGLDPRDWLLKDIRSTGSFNRKLQHRDEQDIQLRIELGSNGEIKYVELLILSME